ncbi:MAG: hypothetical protein ABFD97_04190 [Syntrophobacter sp.]
MKRNFFLISLISLLLICPVFVYGAEDKYGMGKVSTADPDVFINMGTQLLKIGDTNPTNSENADKEAQKKKEVMDQKVDDAIKRAWEGK